MNFFCIVSTEKKVISKDKLINITKYIILLIILVTAFLLRIKLWYRFYALDEQTMLQMTWDLYREPFPLGLKGIVGYPPFFMYLNFMLSFFYKNVLIFLGVIDFDSQFIATGFGPDFTLTLGRLLTSLFGTLIVYMVYHSGKEFYNKNAGLLAAALIAVSRFDIFDSHRFKPDILLPLLMTIVLYLCLKYLKLQKSYYLFIGSFVLGLAVATKYMAVIETVLIIAVVFLARPIIDRSLFTKKLSLIPLGGVIGFFAGAPNWLVHPLSNFRHAFGYMTNVYYFYEDYKAYSQSTLSYGKYIHSILDTFGPIFFALFLVGLFLVVLRRNKIDMVIILYALIYFVFLGSTATFGNRFALPLFPAVALIIGKTLFVDLWRWFDYHIRAKRLAVLVILGWTLFFVFSALGQNLCYFNLIKTASTPDYMLNYRIFHIPHFPNKFKFCSEMFASRRPGDRLTYDLTLVPYRKFTGNDSFEFLSTGFLSEDILTQLQNIALKNELQQRLKKYVPFYRLDKQKFWHNYAPGILWYRIHPSISNIKKKERQIHLPEIFYALDNFNTIYLPLQQYEKNTCFASIKENTYAKWLYSKKKIENVHFYIFSPAGAENMKIMVGKQSKIILRIPDSRILEIDVPSPKPENFFNDWVYKMEISFESRHSPVYMAFFPTYAPDSADKGNFIFTANTSEKIPDLFSPSPYPEWIKKFYTETGIDLPLLQLTSSSTLFKNENKSVDDIEIDYFPLERGTYIIQIMGEQIIQSMTINPQKQASCKVYGIDHHQLNYFFDDHKNWNEIRIEINEPLVFVKIKLKGLRRGNFMVDRIIITPDYAGYLNCNALAKPNE